MHSSSTTVDKYGESGNECNLHVTTHDPMSDCDTISQLKWRWCGPSRPAGPKENSIISSISCSCVGYFNRLPGQSTQQPPWQINRSKQQLVQKISFEQKNIHVTNKTFSNITLLVHSTHCYQADQVYPCAHALRFDLTPKQIRTTYFNNRMFALLKCLEQINDANHAHVTAKLAILEFIFFFYAWTICTVSKCQHNSFVFGNILGDICSGIAPDILFFFFLKTLI